MAAVSEARLAYEAPNAVAAAVWRACIEELEAPKPGNVSFASAGHGMTADDFVASARAVADVLGTPGLSLGERVLGSVEATRAAVSCNTNLGIVLLCAPLAQAALCGDPERPSGAGPGVRAHRGAGNAGRGGQTSRPRRAADAPACEEQHGETRTAGARNNAGFCAPERTHPPQGRIEDLRARLARVLAAAGVEDTERVFAAIRLAGPAGLGASGCHDVRAPAAAPLLAVMREAEDRDRVARQYARCFEDVFDLGLPALAESRARWPRAQAVVVLYLTFLARFKDSHIERKLGAVAAEGVRVEALRLVESLEASKPPRRGSRALVDFDHSLKSRRINPGTSADLTVATLVADNLLRGRGNRVAARTVRGAARLTTT